MFYRQASLFIEYLKNFSEVQFGLFMLAIEDGGDFDKAFRSKYGMSIDEAWEDFVRQLKERQAAIRFAYSVNLKNTYPVSSW